MRFVQYVYENRDNVNLGVELTPGGDIVDLVEITARNLVDFIGAGQDMLDRAKKAVQSATFRVPRSKITLVSPITRPDKVICIGMNYRDHCLEQNLPVPEEPIVFSKFASAITGPFDNIQMPDCTQELDWEVELAVIIGKKGRNISEEQALSHVFGYSVAHDVSARDWQLKKNGGQWLIGKSMDGFCPLGPVVVTTDELGSASNLAVRCSVNGEVKQDSNTSQMVFGTEQLVAYVSRFFTLLPGDVILTGTPPGVGVFKKPPEFLKMGDEVECSIDGIGSIKNKIV